MRTLLAAAVLIMSGGYAQAQDPGIRAGQSAQLAVQHATQQATQNAASAPRNSTNCCAVGYAAKPIFSVKPGTYSKTLEVKIQDRSRGAVIYYTTDGWTPTTASTRYTGPVTIDATTKLQAIAVAPAPFFGRSMVASAQYTITGTAGTSVAGSGTSAMAKISTLTQKTGANDGPPVHLIPVLREGTPVHLVFAADVNSKTADVGDKIALTLADDIKSGDAVLVAKGATAEAVITEVEKTGAGGAPGDIAFQVNSLNVNGNLVRLRGGATMEGEPKPPTAAMLIPMVGPFTVFRHGKDAEIKAGTPITAFVDADTDISLAKPGDEPNR